jgi:hypothetical protein
MTITAHLHVARIATLGAQGDESLANGDGNFRHGLTALRDKLFTHLLGQARMCE